MGRGTNGQARLPTVALGTAEVEAAELLESLLAAADELAEVWTARADELEAAGDDPWWSAERYRREAATVTALAAEGRLPSGPARERADQLREALRARLRALRRESQDARVPIAERESALAIGVRLDNALSRITFDFDLHPDR